MIQLEASVVSRHMSRRVLCSSSQLQSSGELTGIEMARKMYRSRQQSGQ
jgi:hypothetical protein